MTGRRSRVRRPEPVTDEERDDLGEWLARVDRERPRTVRECPSGPCPFVGCKYHLFLDVSPTNGRIKYNFPGEGPLGIPETCALRIAARGGATLEEVGTAMNITRERSRQIEVQALARGRRTLVTLRCVEPGCAGEAVPRSGIRGERWASHCADHAHRDVKWQAILALRAAVLAAVLADDEG